MKRWSWALAPAIVIALAAMPAHASNGKGGGKGGSGATPTASTFAVDQADPHYGDTVSFSATLTAVPSNATPLVGLKCYQNDVWVYQLQEALGSGFPLGGAGVSSAWTRGAASCTADLFYFTYTGKTETGAVYLKQTSFSVAA